MREQMYHMSVESFLQHYLQNAQHLMWFLGAGTSRSAGLPTATDIIWDLKRRYYCLYENQDLQSHDVNNRIVKQKIQTYMDSKGYPASDSPEEYPFYFNLTFGNNSAAQQNYINEALSVDKVSLNVGHRILAALLEMEKIKIIFTTNFDEVIETAYANVSGKNLSAFHLEGSYAALNALNSERFPLYAKIHGDFRYQSIRNLAKDMRDNDSEIQKCFLAASTRYGLIVSGYSGRDSNVMTMFQEAMDQNNAFPHGFFWTVPRLCETAESIQELLKEARDKGVQANIVETGTFDEILSRIWRQVEGKPQLLDKKVGTSKLETTRSQSSDNHQTNPDWNRSPYAPNLTVANLLGEWNEQNKADLEIIGQLANEKYEKWIPKIREVLQQAISPVNLKNGKWHVIDRKGLWQELGRRVFDDSLDKLRQCAVTVLSERDPQFELAPKQRWLAQLYGKVLKYSPELRKGLAETLALLGAKPNALTNCSRHKAEATAGLIIREIFENPDSVLWSSLNDLLPTLAEAAPGEFLAVVKKALKQTPCPFDELFPQESSDRDYLSGLLWALETLAWDTEYFVDVCVVLGELAERDPGGNGMNRPAHSLTTILLPWRPQTTASIDKRKTAVRTLQNEVPRVAWELLLSLLQIKRG